MADATGNECFALRAMQSLCPPCRFEGRRTAGFYRPLIYEGGARQNPCRWRQPPFSSLWEQRPEADTSLPDVLRIVVYFVSFQNLEEFILKRLLAMMLHLAADVRNDGILSGRTDGESSVSVLPVKPHSRVTRFVDVLACIGFQFANKVGHSHFSRNPDE